MQLRPVTSADHAAVIELFCAVFSQSEGAEEGRIVAALAADLLATTPAADLHGFVAAEHNELMGAALFSRLSVASGTPIFILSPMAVAATVQGKGIGQALIAHALEALRAGGVEVAVTYGDPAFYARVGFRHLTPDELAPPFPLSQPEGWLGQSLTGESLTPEPGSVTCVAALNNAAYW